MVVGFVGGVVLLHLVGGLGWEGGWKGEEGGAEKKVGLKLKYNSPLVNSVPLVH